MTINPPMLKRMMVPRAASVALLVSLSVSRLGGQTASQPQTNEAVIRKAIFVVTAFGCVATDKGPKAESERLFDAALKAGLELIQFFKALTPEQQKAMEEKMPMVWTNPARTARGTTDFQLGMLYSTVRAFQEEVQVMRRDIDPDWLKAPAEVWDIRRETLWTLSKCHILGELKH
jgi:hypothetical protein